MDSPARQGLWGRTTRLTAGLLVVWVLVTLLAPWFARDLNQLHFAGFPLGYWIAAQGALLIYLAIIVTYVVLMDRMEQRYGRESDAESDAESTARAEGGPDTGQSV